MAHPEIVSLSSGKIPNDPQFWVDAATGAVRDYAGWHIAPPVDETMVRSPLGGRPRLLHLPTLKINEITKVLNDGVDVTDSVQVDADGMLYLENGHWSGRLSGVEVTLNHGFELDEVPAVAGVISRLAARAASSASNIASQRAGSMYIQYGTSGGLPIGTGLLNQERIDLSAYRVVIK